MTYPEFRAKYREMRKAQNKYFKEGRKLSDLDEAKKLERLLDREAALPDPEENKEGVQAKMF